MTVTEQSRSVRPFPNYFPVQNIQLQLVLVWLESEEIHLKWKYWRIIYLFFQTNSRQICFVTYRHWSVDYLKRQIGIVTNWGQRPKQWNKHLQGMNIAWDLNIYRRITKYEEVWLATVMSIPSVRNPTIQRNFSVTDSWFLLLSLLISVGINII